ncbi:unnamed protein product [Coffea canephora]|uniref:Alpha-1,2-Mannosidase n=1 Tax=Coffea canephora TaxID=49390 RepID=A0A068U8H3_COFCA|nr:unnamed protein product [Coffea canephora]
MWIGSIQSFAPRALASHLASLPVSHVLLLHSLFSLPSLCSCFLSLSSVILFPFSSFFFSQQCCSVTYPRALLTGTKLCCGVVFRSVNSIVFLPPKELPPSLLFASVQILCRSFTFPPPSSRAFSFFLSSELRSFLIRLGDGSAAAILDLKHPNSDIDPDPDLTEAASGGQNYFTEDSRRNNEKKDEHGHHEHESYFGDQDTESLVQTMETLVASVSLESKRLALEDKSDKTKDPKRPALSVGGCRVEGFVQVKKWVANSLDFNKNYDASVFETTIRLVVGGLLSAYNLSGDKDTPSGIPYNVISLAHGNPHNPRSTGVDSILADSGTEQLEFITLSQRIGNPKYRQKQTKNVQRKHTLDNTTYLRSPLTLTCCLAKLNSQMQFHSSTSSFGNFYEYLLKVWIQGNKTASVNHYR